MPPQRPRRRPPPALLRLEREHGAGDDEADAADELRRPVRGDELGGGVEGGVQGRQSREAGDEEDGDAGEEEGAGEEAEVVQVVRAQVGEGGEPVPGVGGAGVEGDDAGVAPRGACDDGAGGGVLARYERGSACFDAGGSVEGMSVELLDRLAEAVRAVLVDGFQQHQRAAGLEDEAADECSDPSAEERHARGNFCGVCQGQEREKAVHGPDGAADGEEDGDVEADVADRTAGEHAPNCAEGLSEAACGLQRCAIFLCVVLADHNGGSALTSIPGSPLVSQRRPWWLKPGRSRRYWRRMGSRRGWAWLGRCLIALRDRRLQWRESCSSRVEERHRAQDGLRV